MIALRQATLPAFLLACLLLGGASAGGYLANLALQLAAVGLIARALLESSPAPLSGQQRILIGFMAAACAIVALQFAPLPLSLWEALGSRRALAEADRAAGVTPYPAFLTLMPHETLKSAVWALPPLGLSLAMLRIRNWQAWHFAVVILIATVLSVLLGALQITGGGHSPWYVYRITNRGSTVGLFANSNHLATLLLVSLPFLAALIAQSRPRHPPARGTIRAVGAALLSVILVGIFVNGSLAAYGLAAPVLAASLMILTPRHGLRRAVPFVLVPLIAAGIVAVLATAEGRRMLAESSALSPDARQAIFANSWQAIRDFLPAGSGLGSFAEIYRLYEDPGAVGLSYVNHAHNDYLEWLLETGVPGGLLLTAFLLWWGWRAFRVWYARDADPFARAAVIAGATILVHSIVDYPLRTAAIGGVFAMCCVLMTQWCGGDDLLIGKRAD